MRLEDKTSFSQVAFWLLWAILLLIIPLYGFTLLFELGAVKQGLTFSYLSPVVGLFVFVAQIFLFIKSYRQMKQREPLSRAFLTLLGGTILVALIWAGGCTMMGPFRLAG